jgi:hypothetical protein
MANGYDAEPFTASYTYNYNEYGVDTNTILLFMLVMIFMPIKWIPTKLLSMDTCMMVGLFINGGITINGSCARTVVPYILKSSALPR